MFSSRWTTMETLTVAVSVLLVLHIQCHVAEGSGSDTRQTYTGYESGGGGGPKVAPRTQWTMETEVDEDDAEATLRESVVKAVRNTRSRTHGHAIRSGSLEDLVTPAQVAFLDLAHLYLPALTNVSDVCRRDLIVLYWGMAHLDTLIKNGTLWPLKLVDSWGKFSDGYLVGNLQTLGFFKECLDIRVYEPLWTTDSPYYTLNHPSQRQNSPPVPLNTYSTFRKSQNSYSHLQDQYKLTHTPERHQSPPATVFKSLNMPRTLQRVFSQPSLDPQQPRIVPLNAHKALNLPLDPQEQPRDGTLRAPELDTTTTTTTTTSPLPLADFSGQYCLVTYTGQDKELQQLRQDIIRTPGLSSALPVSLSLMAYGTCIPSSCTREELKVSLDAALWQEGLQVDTLDCQVEGRHPALGAAEITGIVVVSVLVTLMLLGALADLYTAPPDRQHLRQGPLQFLLAFSVTTNVQKLFHLETRKLPGVISSIHGIRFISILWVIFGHQFSYSMMVAENVAEIPELSKPTYAQIILNADKSVDTFLMLSGLLVTLGLMGMVGRTGRFSLPLYLVHRVLRLCPPVALCTMLVATLSGLAVSGPYAGQYWLYVVQGCRKRWWSDVTLVNNLMFPHLGQLNMEEGEGACCLPHTWYLGVDTQLYLIMPLLLLPLTRWPRKGCMWLLLWTIASIIIPTAIIGAYDLWPTTLFVMDPVAENKYTQKVYIMPWCRAGPYLVGAWAGYLLHYAKEHPSITRLRPWQVCLGWVAALGIALAVVFGIAPYNYIGTPSQVPEMSTAEAAMYGGVHRAAWSLAVAWVVVACTWGYGGPVAWLLEHPLWQPFSRLSYCLYLASLPLQYVIIYSAKRANYYTRYSKVQETSGVVLVTLVVATFVTLASESPVLRLEKMLLRRSTDERPRVAPSEVTTPPMLETGQSKGMTK